MKKTLKILIASVAAGSFIFNPPLDSFNFIPTVQAEVKIYTGVGDCVQSELVTAAQAKNYAKLRAELNAKDQAGIYISGYYKQNNFSITENEVSVIANNILNIIGEVKYSTDTQIWGNTPLIKHIATLQANIDTDGIAAYIQRQNKEYIKTNGAVSRNQTADKDIKENLNRIDTLIERYNKATSQAEKDKIRAEFSQADKNALAGQKYNEGNKFYDKGEYQKAIELYNESLALNPKYDKAYNNRGNAYKKLQKYEQAISDYNNAIEINPNNALAYHNRGIFYANLNQHDKAIVEYNKAIELNPNLAETYVQRGSEYSILKQYDKAIADRSKAIELNPNHKYAYRLRGLNYILVKRYEDAIADFTRAIEINPNDADCYLHRGDTYRDYLKDYDKAFLDYSRFIELDQPPTPHLIYVYHKRGMIYKDHFKDYQKVIADFTKLIELEQKPNWASYVARAKCYKALGETEKADADMAKARELGYYK